MPTDETESPRDGEEDFRWLTESEKEAWTGLVSLVLLLPGALDAPLQREFGLTLFDYMVLSGISEAPDHELRMSDLAFLVNGSLSRLSNVVKRFEQRGWVARRPDESDGRYTLARLTPAGRELVVAAAPVHVTSVRRRVIELLDADDHAALARIAARIKVLPSDLRGRSTTGQGGEQKSPPAATAQTDGLRDLRACRDSNPKPSDP